ncbi:DUF6506 family protein [Desulfosoma caldarium]|uniref:Uncharacterized protein n=1 Tax=Desulfosoma caldarium TaxID=610254 RepID=A0A3N1UI53_9BACT|nr:DUF6506 family protein [Desulfosoma caldarium]ROQ90944.1 hypothetical protein EDC27_2214 [Desulfosoma caldarium]
MSDVVKAAFLFVAPEADPDVHRHWVKTPKVHLLVVGVADYRQAVTTAKVLVEKEGISALELCGGFGNRGTALVAEAVGGSVPVGVVRFDAHPGLGHVRGDTLF